MRTSRKFILTLFVLLLTFTAIKVNATEVLEVPTLPETMTIKELADELGENIVLTYDNYQYYRSVINDTSNFNILKLYSEGILKIDENGNINPNKELTIEEVNEIKMREIIFPERPTYVKRTSIPILMYHQVDTLPQNGPSGLYVSKENFCKQLDALKQNGYNTVTMEQVYQHWINDVPLAEKPIVLSFDDGYNSYYDFIWKELTNRGMTGTFYMVTSYIGDRTEQLRNIHREGIEIGSHTVSHKSAKYINNSTLLNEYKESKEQLENITGGNVRHFCYPFGNVTNYAVQTLKELGYNTAVKTSYGKAYETQGIYGLKRIRIDYYDSINGFLNKIK